MQGRLKVWEISIMGIEPAPYTNRTDETFPLTNSNQLPVSQDFLIFFYKDFYFSLFFIYNNVRLTNNNCFIRSTLLHQKKKRYFNSSIFRSKDLKIRKEKKKRKREITLPSHQDLSLNPRATPKSFTLQQFRC